MRQIHLNKWEALDFGIYSLPEFIIRVRRTGQSTFREAEGTVGWALRSPTRSPERGWSRFCTTWAPENRKNLCCTTITHSNFSELSCICVIFKSTDKQFRKVQNTQLKYTHNEREENDWNTKFCSQHQQLNCKFLWLRIALYFFL